MYKFDKNFTT